MKLKFYGYNDEAIDEISNVTNLTIADSYILYTVDGQKHRMMDINQFELFPENDEGMTAVFDLSKKAPPEWLLNGGGKNETYIQLTEVHWRYNSFSPFINMVALESKIQGTGSTIPTRWIKELIVFEN